MNKIIRSQTCRTFEAIVEVTLPGRASINEPAPFEGDFAEQLNGMEFDVPFDIDEAEIEIAAISTLSPMDFDQDKNTWSMTFRVFISEAI